MTIVCRDPSGPYEGGHNWQYLQHRKDGRVCVRCSGCDTAYYVGDRRLYAVLRELYPAHTRTIGYLELVGTTDIG